MGPLVPRALAEANASRLPKSSSLVPSSLIQNKCFRNRLLPGALCAGSSRRGKYNTCTTASTREALGQLVPDSGLLAVQVFVGRSFRTLAYPCHGWLCSALQTQAHRVRHKWPHRR